MFVENVKDNYFGAKSFKCLNFRNMHLHDRLKALCVCMYITCQQFLMCCNRSQLQMDLKDKDKTHIYSAETMRCKSFPSNLKDYHIKDQTLENHSVKI